MLVFDAMRVAEFKMQYCPHTWEYRRFALNQIFDGRDDLTYFELLPVLYQGTDTSMILKLLDEAIANNEEGVMINFTNKPYEFKRSNALLKVKRMNTMDLEIIGFEEGEGRLTGTLGAILVRYKNGNTVKVGSGFSDELRTKIWANKDSYLGCICEIQFFEESSNADGGISLRFPIFKDFRPDKLTPDF
jgi:DNA ligase-1